MSDLDDGLCLADIGRDRAPITEADEAAVRRLIATQAAEHGDEPTLLAMLGLTPPDGPPPDHCASCGRQMWHKNWPQHWREGRSMYGTDGKCVGCRRKELVAAGEGAAPRKSRKPAGRPGYRRKTG